MGVAWRRGYVHIDPCQLRNCNYVIGEYACAKYLRVGKNDCVNTKHERVIVNTKRKQVRFLLGTGRMPQGQRSSTTLAHAQPRKLSQTLFNSLSRPTFGDRLCPHCTLTITTSYQDHLFSYHLTKFSIDDIVTWLDQRDHEHIFQLAEDLSSFVLNSS